ncbi:LysM peptidoglycan-binding domain-containing protein [Arcicella rosea]|uniref:Membrane-bound lytic murein transglycosylase D n=1 Tax=Arcicella rosea TaxID=502909 RepID=A0A841EGX3_9BACT|nr:LysM peptidoglycan-binding domain-containing protein [Arcicella rosea]MBB6002395.1 membrane-bound lytic murein transglycosylase D [Arcicella rosea]
MGKYILLLIIVFFSFISLQAQSLPRSIKVGSVNVKYDSYARNIIEKEIQSLNNNRKYLDVLVDKMVIHFPVIERILADAGVPDEIKYLCVQESVFDPDAISISGAVGYWQFKTETAREVGLRVDGLVDERKHLAASTKAAAIYLNRNNQLLNNWMTTLLSYRIGQGAIKNHPATDWIGKKEITVTNTTDWYLLRFLAHRFLLESEYNKVKNNPDNNFLYEYTNGKGKSVTEIANELAVTPALVVQNNAWLKGTTVPKDRDYVVYVPMSNQKYRSLSQSDLSQKATVTPTNPIQDIGFPVLVRLTQGNSKTEPIYYEINGKKGILSIDGDTPASIANRGDISLSKFLKFNDLDVDSRIIPNEVYYLKKKEHRAMVAYHTVEANETLWSISQMYGIHLEDLMAKNRIPQMQRLQKGRLLWLIETRPDTPIQYVDGKKEVPKMNTEKTVIITNVPKEPEPKPSIITEKPAEVIAKEQKPVSPVVVDTKEKVIAKETIPTIDKVKTVAVSPEPSNVPKVEDKVLIRETKAHIVSAKDTYFGIAQLYDMKVGEVLSLNNIKLDEKLQIGQVIKVYKPTTSLVTGARESEKTPEVKIVESKTKDKSIITKPEQAVKVVPEVKPNTKTNVSTKEIVEKPSEVNPNTSKILTKEEKDIPKVATSKVIAREETAKASVKKIHTVKAKETLFSISRMYGITVAEIKKWNKLNSNVVEIDQELLVSNTTIMPSTPSIKLIEESDSEKVAPRLIQEVAPKNDNNVYHTMKAGETVFRVSKIHGVTVDQIVKWNNLKNFSVSVGQKLLIKK